jgi:hypothetical protein
MLHNPFGFDQGDLIELAAAALLVCLLLVWRPRLERFAGAIAQRPVWCMALLAVLPVALRLALLPNHPIPTPAVSDDFSYLLLADTLSHLRLANPTHPFHQFFETFFVLQEPAYSSIFPLGQGMVLALGRLLFGHPWAGVAFSIGALSALCYWMLRAWTTPGWALLGGVLAAIEFGPLNQWMSSYWGGAVSAVAGCLIFGALPRLRDRGRGRDAILLGAGLGLQLLTRPFEFLLLALSVAMFLPRFRVRLWTFVAAAMLPAVVLTLLQNRAATGSWITLPYQVSRYQYGVPATFTFQPNPAPHRALTPQQQLDSEAQCAVHGDGTDSLKTYLERLVFRVRYYRFFFLVPLYLALPFFLPSLRRPRFLWVAVTILLFSLGANFYPYFYPHYIAALTCLFLLVSIIGLERLRSVSADAAQIVVVLCLAHFLFWYSLQLFANQPFAQAFIQHETWDAINFGDPEGRLAINARLAAEPGKQLVFVRYGPRHAFEEWVHNAADIDASRVVWARDLGAEENEKLRRYYSDRTAWLMEPDARPPRLSAYDGSFNQGGVPNPTEPDVRPIHSPGMRRYGRSP